MRGMWGVTIVFHHHHDAGARALSNARGLVVDNCLTTSYSLTRNGFAVLVENPTTNPRGPSNFDWVLAVGFFNPVVDVRARQRRRFRERGKVGED